MKKLIWIMAVLMLAACQQTDEESLLREKQGNSELKYVTDSDPVKRQKMTSQQAARHLAKLAVQVPDVHDATALVLGNYVAVGIDVDKDLDRSRVGVIKYSVAEAIKNDPYGKQAVVIADADAVERLRGLGRKISQGHPVEGITDELSQIVARYMPEGPINERPQTEGNKQSIPDKDKKEIEKVEKEQSKQK
ncbi:YhcN/YlaJ family sporulation lipoprotein [Halobacillus yeomjeoni]|uniref:YhcN/YlaJ family sporulation lipoprotein n=1 Tax=Halobacillus yeomjeoni TaxID=311194 RepID=A0A931MU45_9BACI|nr:YhcN/YlaJ family sporulation lipoprotein [Halobacillus yeomjeoni]MBH0229004.1 YhcN/YlaJ family sporulation lipoprotein [Halobacillus yeomjeoni]